ncbi:hypothetical protein EOM09_05865 [bacterium]|nr:hypothetical protein [bacterium]
MNNWSTDTSRLKNNSSAYTKWKLEQLINFGLDQKKISKKQLIKYLPELKIDQKSRQFLESIIK